MSSELTFITPYDVLSHDPQKRIKGAEKKKKGLLLKFDFRLKQGCKKMVRLKAVPTSSLKRFSGPS